MNKINRIYVLIFLLLLFLLTLTPHNVLAQDAVEPENVETTQENVGNTEENIAKPLDEDTEALQNDLLLQIPEETDNPNYTLLFTDPTDKGVSISIDGAQKTPIQSPYSLPALGIGKHTLQFTYTNLEDAESTYETTITVIPRPPEIKPPVISDGMLNFTGTAIPGGTLKIFLTGATKTYRETLKVEDSGNWSIDVSGQFEEAVYTATAYVTKNGFGSDFAEPVTFSIGTSNNVVTPDETAGDLDFSFTYILVPDFYNKYIENTHFLLYTILLLVLGLLLGILMHRFLFVRGERSLENKFKSMLSGDDKEQKGKKDKKKKGEEWVDTKPKEGDETPTFNTENELDQVAESEISSEGEVTEATVELDEGGETMNVSDEAMGEQTADNSEELPEEVSEETTIESTEVASEDGEYIEDPNAEVPEFISSSTEEVVASEEVTETAGSDVTDQVEQVVEEVPEETVESVTEETEPAPIATAEEVTEASQPGMDEIEPPSEALGDSDDEGKKRSKLGIFAFLSRGKDKDKKEKKDEKVEDDTVTESELPLEATNVQEKNQELSREEFLEQFKNYDPDPDTEERMGSMSDKLATDQADKQNASETEVADEVESTPEEVVKETVEEEVEEVEESPEAEETAPPAKKKSKKSTKKSSSTAKKSASKKTPKTTKKKAPRKKGAPRRNIKITLTSKD